MTHVSTELLQQYLAGEADLADMDRIAAHLTECEACSAQFAALAAEDAALTAALRLDDADLAWADSLDLTRPVLQELNPLRKGSIIFLCVMLFVLPVSWLLNQSLSLIAQVAGTEGPVGTMLELTQTLGPAVWRLLRFLMSGGLMASLWPLLALGAVIWLWRTKTTRGGSEPPAETV